MLPKDKEFIRKYNQKMAALKAENRKVIIDDYVKRLNFYMADQQKATQLVDHGFIDIEIRPIREKTGEPEPNYFSEKRIAVYAAVFGNYDEILEPLVVPDNCDFYIITDQEVPEESVWQPLKIDLAEYGLENENSIIKNRYFKMHPHVIFPDHDFSLYIDGNVLLVTDPTEFIYTMNEYGFMGHDHFRVNCSYVEVERSRVQKLGPEEEYDAHVAYLESEGLPYDYGLIECTVLFREHTNPKCIVLMEEWWQEFLANSKRDQVNLPLVLWRHGIRTNEVAGLGTDLYSNYTFRRVPHALNRAERAKLNNVPIAEYTIKGGKHEVNPSKETETI